jgi:hypothetical protein
MKTRVLLVLALLLAGLLLPAPRPAQAAAGLELYGNIQTMGITVTLAPGDDPDQDAAANVQYRIHGAEAYRPGFPLSRVGATRFVGSLFRLVPGATYDVRVTFSDPDGALKSLSLEGSGSTRPEISIPAANHSYYVSPAGSGSTCSLAAACSLAEGVNQAQPGDEVVLRGGVATYAIEIYPNGASGSTVNVTAANPSPTLNLDLSPATVTLPSYAILTVADTHSGSEVVPGLWHTIPITITGGGTSYSASVGLLVGGTHTYLPLLLKK